jgi:hypothetical protein
MTGRVAAAILTASLALVGTAGPAMAQATFCMTAVDVLPPPGDPTNAVPEIRVIELSIAPSGQDIFAANGAVIGGNRGGFLFSGTVRIADAQTVLIGLTGVATPPATSLTAYRAVMQFGLAGGAGVYNDNFAPVPFGTDQMTVAVAAGPCP